MKRLYRSDTDKIIGGVCGGLGEYLRVDPLILRVLFVALAMMNGIGIVVYILMWLLVPVRFADHLTHEQVVRQNAEEIRGRARELGDEARNAFGGKWRSPEAGSRMLIAGGILVAIGLLSLLRNFGLLRWLSSLWPLGVIALGVVILLNNLKGRS